MKSIDVLFYAHNQAQFVLKGLSSIANQKFRDQFYLRLLCIDDGSLDGTRELMRDWVADHARELDSNWSIEFRDRGSEPPRGQSATYKEGLSWTNADFFAVLEGDDYWIRNDHICTLVGDLESHPFASASFSSWISLDPESRLTGSRIMPASANLENRIVDSRSLLENNPPGTLSACVYRGSHLKAVTPGLMTLSNVADWGTNLLISQFGPLIWNSNVSLLYMDVKTSLWRRETPVAQRRKMVELLDSYRPLLSPGIQGNLDDRVAALRSSTELPKRLKNAAKHPIKTLINILRLR